MPESFLLIWSKSQACHLKSRQATHCSCRVDLWGQQLFAFITWFQQCFPSHWLTLGTQKNHKWHLGSHCSIVSFITEIVMNCFLSNGPRQHQLNDLRPSLISQGEEPETALPSTRRYSPMTVSPCSDSGGSVCTRLRLLFLHGMFFTGALSVNSMAWPVVHTAAWILARILCVCVCVCVCVSLDLNRQERTWEDGRGANGGQSAVNPA